MGFDLHFDVDGDNFTSAGEASGDTKRQLRRIGLDPEIIRRVAICMYEGEINMVIHAHGGTIDLTMDPQKIVMVLQDTGPGIADINAAMQEGYSTATQSVRDLGFGAGMGLPNMKRYSDRMEVTSELGVGTRVEMEIQLA